MFQVFVRRFFIFSFFGLGLRAKRLRVYLLRSGSGLGPLRTNRVKGIQAAI